MPKFKEFFSFNKAERRGVFVLLLIISIIILYRIFGTSSLARLTEQNDFQQDIENFLSTLEEPDEKKEIVKKKRKYNDQKRKPQLKLHLFDPNMMSYNLWLEMGLSESQARTIENYKSKGGRFWKPSDFKKIYCISEAEYEKMLPYIIINIEKTAAAENSVETKTIFDINRVDMIEIQRVKGIGPSFAKRIIKYREILGGYVQIDQLMEVYGMDSVRYQSIRPSFSLSLDSLKRMSLNSSSYYQLRRHPYISDQLAYEITQYRIRHGEFKSVEELKKIKMVNDSLFERINLYFAAVTK